MEAEVTAEPTGGVEVRRLAKRTERFGMILPVLGKWGHQITGTLTWFRKCLEREIVRQRGRLTILDVDLVNRAARFESAALIAQRQIVKNPDMPPEKVLDILKTICWATTQRSSIIAKLGLKQDVSGNGTAAWDALVSPPEAPEGQEVSAVEAPAPDAAGEATEGEGG